MKCQMVTNKYKMVWWNRGWQDNFLYREWPWGDSSAETQIYEDTSYVTIWWKSVLGKGNSKCKDSEREIYL